MTIRRGEIMRIFPLKMWGGAIASLAGVGAKNILLANLPDLGQLPATRTSANSASLSALTQAHNQGLRRTVKVFPSNSILT